MLSFWFFMLCTALLIPLVMLVFGARFSYKSPKEINALFGYRTTMSMKNKGTWDYAHRYFGRLWFWCGLFSLPVSAVPMIVVYEHSESIVGLVGCVICIIQLIPLMGAIIPTEIALRKEFDSDGNRKQS